jgi:hypothetical protein
MIVPVTAVEPVVAFVRAVGPRCEVKLFWNGGYRSNEKLSNEDARCISW